MLQVILSTLKLRRWYDSVSCLPIMIIKTVNARRLHFENRLDRFEIVEAWTCRSKLYAMNTIGSSSETVRGLVQWSNSAKRLLCVFGWTIADHEQGIVGVINTSRALDIRYPGQISRTLLPSWSASSFHNSNTSLIPRSTITSVHTWILD